MFCRFCGNEILGDSAFCSYCGRNLEYKAEELKSESPINDVEQTEPTINETLDEAYNDVEPKIKPTNYKARYIIACSIVALTFACALIYNYQKDHPEWLNAFSISKGDQAKGDITLQEFNRIEMGMTYDEVVNIIGTYGTESARTEMGGYTTVIFMWDGVGMLGANASVTFQNGQAISKAQVGLD